MRLSHRGREVTRLEAFSDGVFAFSATLLVVSLEVPRTFPELLEDLQGFVPFALSFSALILLWSVHNAFFRRYGLQDRTTVILNSCLLFVVLFFVYPLKFVVEGIAFWLLGFDRRVARIESFDDLATLFMLYSSGLLAVFLCVSLLYLHAWRRRADLELTPHETYEAALFFRHYFLQALMGLVSIGLAWKHVGLQFGLPGAIFGLLGPLCWAHAVVSKRWEPAESTAS